MGIPEPGQALDEQHHGIFGSFPAQNQAFTHFQKPLQTL